MKMDWKWVALLLVSAALTNTPAWANPDELVLSCPPCEDQERAAWTSLAALVPGEKRFVYIANFESELLWRFSVNAEYDKSQAKVQVTPSDVAQEVELLFENWLRVKHVGANYEVVIPDIGINSAYEIVRNSRSERQLGAYLYDHKSELFNFPEDVISESFSFMGMAASAYFSNNGQTDIAVAFPDASRAHYTIEYPNKHDETNIEISYVDGTAVDSESNPIPESLNSFRGSEGTLEFLEIQNLNFTNWLERVGDLGFEITGNWPDSGSVTCQYACNASRTCEIDCVQNN